jgi:hypothetical protein
MDGKESFFFRMLRRNFFLNSNYCCNILWLMGGDGRVGMDDKCVDLLSVLHLYCSINVSFKVLFVKVFKSIKLMKYLFQYEIFTLASTLYRVECIFAMHDIGYSRIFCTTS